MEGREQDERKRARKRHGYEGSVETNQRIAQGAINKALGRIKAKVARKRWLEASVA